MEYAFDLEFSVRDYECDLQGIVNNAVYQHYLEHARHEFLRHAGIDFARMHSEGIDPVVVRIEIDYKSPLKSGDRFVVRSNLRKKGRLQVLFFQDVFRLPDRKLAVNAVVHAACIKDGRPFMPAEIVKMVDAFGVKEE